MCLILFILIMYYLDRLFLYYIIIQMKDWKLYVNTYNCGWCHEQIKYLGEYAKYVDIVHCDDSKNEKECSELPALPMWKNSYTGKIEKGAILGSQRLAER